MKWDGEIQDLFSDTFKERKKPSGYWMPLTAMKKELCSSFSPRTRRFLMRYQFSMLFLVMCCFYLLIFFVYPTLVSGGYADACESFDLIYLANRHVCISEEALSQPSFGLNLFFRDYPLMSRSQILWSTIFPLEKHRLRDKRINDINKVRNDLDSRDARLNIESFSINFDWDKFLGNVVVVNDSEESE